MNSITMKCEGLKSSDESLVLPTEVVLNDGKATCVYVDHADVAYASLDEAMSAHLVINPRDGRNAKGELILYSDLAE